MSSQQYVIGDQNRIHIVDPSVFAAGAWEEDATFDETLAAFGKMSMGLATLGSRKEPWVGELVAKQLLDLEEGASLVTGINCRRGVMPFTWQGERFYSIRPDFGVLLITSQLGEKPINNAESEIKSRIFVHRDPIFSLHLATTHKQPDPTSIQTFDWWREFWGKRGVEMRRDGCAPTPAEGPAPAPAKKHAGGAPVQYDWDAFDREIVRVADLDGLPQDRTKLYRQMMQWCQTNWGAEPADSMVRARIKRLWPG